MCVNHLYLQGWSARPPSTTILSITRLKVIWTRLAEKRNPWRPAKVFGLQVWDPGWDSVVFYRREEVEQKNWAPPRRAKRLPPEGERDRRDRAQEWPDGERYRSGSGAEGERLLLKARNVSKKWRFQLVLILGNTQTKSWRRCLRKL